jgi:hypothetical protein
MQGDGTPLHDDVASECNLESRKGQPFESWEKHQDSETQSNFTLSGGDFLPKFAREL